LYQSLNEKQVFLCIDFRTFVAINNATAGFNASTDSIVEVTGLTGTLVIGNFVTA
jgi:hypothetical protein